MKKLLLILLCLPLPVTAAEFHGYACKSDCSGHKAGYEWAQRKGVTDESECGGNSKSFREGCYAYVEEQQEKQKEDSEESDAQ